MPPTLNDRRNSSLFAKIPSVRMIGAAGPNVAAITRTDVARVFSVPVDCAQAVTNVAVANRRTAVRFMFAIPFSTCPSTDKYFEHVVVESKVSPPSFDNERLYDAMNRP